MSRRLTRDTRHGMLGGVAAGLGDYLGVDPVLVRVGFVLLTLVHGLGVLCYLACWFLTPRREAVPAAQAPLAGAGVEAAVADPASAQLAVGSLLVLGGALLLADNLDWLRWPHWMRLETLWPLLLVALGVGLILKSRRGH